MKRSGDSTHHCRSPTPTLNGCDLTPSIRTQSFEQEYSYLTASMTHPLTPYSHNALKAFHEEPDLILSRGRQNMCIRLWHAPRISLKFAVEWKFGLQRYGRDENGTRYHPALVKIFLRHLDIQFSWETKQRYAAVVGSFTPDPFCVWGWSICQSFGALAKRHATSHTRISRTIWRSKFP